jgi:hypothetical protein
MKKLYPASEIAEMRLPGLPTSKARVIDRANAEGWYFEEQKGRGGTRRVYEIPEQYKVIDPRAGTAQFLTVALGHLAANGGTKAAQRLAGYDVTAQPGDDQIQAIAGGGLADPKLLTLAIQAFEEWAAERKLEVPTDRKAAIISVLYDYLAKGADQSAVERFLQVVG